MHEFYRLELCMLNTKMDLASISTQHSYSNSNRIFYYAPITNKEHPCLCVRSHLHQLKDCGRVHMIVFAKQTSHGSSPLPLILKESGSLSLCWHTNLTCGSFIFPYFLFLTNECCCYLFQVTSELLADSQRD